MMQIDEFKIREMSDPKSTLGAFYRIQKCMEAGLPVDSLGKHDFDVFCKFAGTSHLPAENIKK